VQRILWDKVKGTHQEKYVADPDKGSMHNFGMAVDLTVIDEKGVPLDMGTGFDEFSDASQPSREDEFLANGTLSTRHITNRLILRHAMEASGFIQLPHEWWHFDAAPKAHVRAHYQIVE
jgi:D-alanyl-D-alanine dipeptidase